MFNVPSDTFITLLLKYTTTYPLKLNNLRPILLSNIICKLAYFIGIPATHQTPLSKSQMTLGIELENENCGILASHAAVTACQ